MSMIMMRAFTGEMGGGVPTRALRIIRWSRSLGSVRGTIAPGWESVYPLRRNGKRPHVEKMAATIPGEMVLQIVLEHSSMRDGTRLRL